jgi:hypothetical protein
MCKRHSQVIGLRDMTVTKCLAYVSNWPVILNKLRDPFFRHWGSRTPRGLTPLSGTHSHTHTHTHTLNTTPQDEPNSDKSKAKEAALLQQDQLPMFWAGACQNTRPVLHCNPSCLVTSHTPRTAPVGAIKDLVARTSLPSAAIEGIQRLYAFCLRSLPPPPPSLTTPTPPSSPHPWRWEPRAY